MTLKDSIVILGEGPTEFYYIQSLRDLARGLNFKPDIPKHTNMQELGAKIEECINSGYSKVLCMIDMDSKKIEAEQKRYLALKKKYAKPFSKPKNGIHCEVKFYETHLCTELFFLYYFKYTSRNFNDQAALIKELNDMCAYEKTVKFFNTCNRFGGLHGYFEKNGGRLMNALVNAERSCKEREQTYRDYTYSELHKLLEELGILQAKTGK